MGNRLRTARGQEVSNTEGAGVGPRGMSRLPLKAASTCLFLN